MQKQTETLPIWPETDNEKSAIINLKESYHPEVLWH